MANLIRNKTERVFDLFIYGDIVDEKQPDFWTGKVSENDVDTVSFRNAMSEVAASGVQEINLYINSAGGSVFAASAMLSMLKRVRDSGVNVKGYIDGICASAATYLLMGCDKIYFYRNSQMMVHKPLMIAYGNAEDLRKAIETLDGVEDNLMIPTYQTKTEAAAAEIKSWLERETWFSGNPEDEFYIGKNWTAEDMEEAKPVTACASPLLKNYKNLPECLKKAPGEEKKINYSEYEKMIQEVKK